MRCSSMPAWRSATSDLRRSSDEVRPFSKSCLLRTCSSLADSSCSVLISNCALSSESVFSSASFERAC